MKKCVILTESKYIAAAQENWYLKQVLLEQRLISDAMERKGWNVFKKSWDDMEFDWSSMKFILVREVWDYFNRFDEFEKAVRIISQKTKLINPISQILWNTDKHYMLELQRKGVSIVPSYFIEQGDDRKLKDLLIELKWNEAVVKPAISGAAKNTFRINRESADEIDHEIKNYRCLESFMLQPFMANIVTQGEISMIVFGGEFSHAVIKRAKQGDFRVQDDWGGTVANYVPLTEEIDFAIKAVNACEPSPVYARVDIVRDNFGEIALGELELIEPELWFRMSDGAADKLAAAIVRSLG